ncbi:MAG TPA: hypothetical protein VGR77_02920 [Candidatus Dormibacteraeota bacterium]|nr:hypothetical protein [Candidatus Dormibacteraeota bacterium]
MASAAAAGCGARLDSGVAETTGAEGASGGAGGVAAATGGVHPVGGAGSAAFGCTIFSRFSSTLKLKRRRFGFPRRPPSGAAGAATA